MLAFGLAWLDGWGLIGRSAPDDGDLSCRGWDAEMTRNTGVNRSVGVGDVVRWAGKRGRAGGHCRP